MTNIERLDRAADIMRRKWIYEAETSLFFNRDNKNVIKGSLTSKGYLIVTVQEDDFKVALSYQKAAYVYCYGAYDETLFDVHHINLQKNKIIESRTFVYCLKNSIAGFTEMYAKSDSWASLNGCNRK